MQKTHSFSPAGARAPGRNGRQARARRGRRQARVLRRLAGMALGLAFVLGVGVLLFRLGAGAGSGLHAAAGYTPAAYDLSAYRFDAQDPYLLLVNNNLPLAQDYAPAELAVADADTGKQLEAAAAAAYQEMAADAAEDGVSLVLCSGYRDYDYQAGLFEKRMQKYLDQGRTAEDAAALARTIVAKPGCSEHQTGLAADIVTEKYTGLDSGFAKTDAYAWLVQHGAEYGFILRYPEDRQADTGIVYEPWHWRYVGVENARAIAASGLSLEGFLALHTAASDLAGA